MNRLLDYEYAREYHSNLLRVAAQARQASRARAERQPLSLFMSIVMKAKLAIIGLNQYLQWSSKYRSVGVLESTCC